MTPGTLVNEVRSHRSVSMLPTPSKLFEKVLLIRIRVDTDLPTIIPDYQFRFREISPLFNKRIEYIAITDRRKDFVQRSF